MNEPRMVSPEGAAPVDAEFAQAVREGLSAPSKSLPCRFFYDARGSALFEDITELDAYYPTRTEIGILRERAGDIAARTAPGTVLVEYGSGSSRKTELLLARMPQLAAYVAIDVSISALEDAAARLAAKFPGLRVVTIEGDFRDALHLPPDLRASPKLGFFPGSTIGNLVRKEAHELLAAMAASLGSGSRLIIGVDLEKDLKVLRRAYHDEKGVTAAFNKNLLARINRELGGDFDLSAFDHEACWNEGDRRIEMHLVSRKDQAVHVLGQRYGFARGEHIHTENSHKYTIARFQELAASSGWTAAAVWTDPKGLFSVHELVAR